MPLEIVLGKPKTGKSRYIYEKIEADIANGKKAILFVPSQLRLETENNYMEYLKKDGIIGVNITTISEYVKDSISNIDIYDNEKYISKLDRKIILADVISKNKNELKLFKNVVKKDGFLELMYSYIDLLRKANYDPKMLEKSDIKSNVTYSKFKEISNIYTSYVSAVNEKFIDGVDEINLFLKNMSNIDFSNTTIYFDAYNNFTENEFLVIEKMLTYVKNVTISLTTDISEVNDIYSNNTNSIFEVSNITYLKLLSIANTQGMSVENTVKYIKYIKQKEDIKLLSSNIFENIEPLNFKAENVYLNIFSNTYEEIVNVSNVINKKIRQGYKYNDINIYTSDILSYQKLITRIFMDTNIPVYVANEESIKFSKLTLYIEKYLNIIKNSVSKDKVIEILKLELTDISKEEICEFENYLIEFNISHYLISKKFKLNNNVKKDHIYDLEKLNKIREKILDMYDVKISKEESITYYITKIYEHLEKNNIFNNYKKEIEKIEVLSDEFDIASLEKSKQVWTKICEVFDSMSKVCTGTITLEKFIQVFNLALNNTVIKSTPPVIDCVNVVDINLFKNSTTKIAFFIGVNEGKFPSNIEEDVLFKDSELNDINKSDINFKQTTVSKQNMELYNIYQVLNSVQEEIYVYIPSSDFSGKSYRPSSIINNIKNVLDLKINGNIASQDSNKCDLCNIYSKKELFNKIVNNIKNNENISDTVLMFNYIKKEDKYDELLRYIKDDSNLKDETLKLIYSDKLDTSISKLELFKKCPFSYYMKYLLKIEPRKEFEISSLDIGSFMHAVLEEFSKYLLVNNIKWHTLIQEDDSWKIKLNDIIDERLNINLKNKNQSIKYEILKEKLTHTMQKVILVISKSFSQSDFLPYGYEIEFKEGGLFAPINIKISEEKSINIIGKIDRVDTFIQDEKTYVRIIDYKSSSKDLKLDDIKEGISLQLITYLTSFIENLSKSECDKKVLPAGMLYFNLSDKLVNLKEYIKDEEKLKNQTIKALRMKGIFLKDVDIIQKMDNKIDSEERLIDISKSTLKKENTSRALTNDEYCSLFKEVKDILKGIGKEILSGVVNIQPNKKADSCKYCNYSSICRKDSCI